jgi:carbonic anhydrase/acetyltransferase-like protein (isoleucine patch superfamily)
VIMGTPAKIVRDIKPADLEALKANAERYIKRSQRYLQEMQARA